MMTQEQINVDLFDLVKKQQSEIDELSSWKISAMTVLGEWEKVWEAAGEPGVLGSSQAASTLKYILDKR